MTKEQFFELLDYYFRNVNSYEYREIRKEYEDRFQEGEAQGKTEEEITAELGSPKKIFEKAKEEGRVYPGRKDTQNFIDQMTEGMNEFFSSLRRTIFREEKEDFEEQEELSQHQMEFDADVMRIDIRYVGAKVSVKEGDSDKIKISYTISSKNDTMNVGKEDRVLKIETSNVSKTLRGNLESVEDLYIEIPKNSTVGLNILGVSGDLHLTTRREEVTVSTVSGNIHWEKLGEERMESRLKTVSGDIKIHGPGADLFIKTVSGNIDIDEENQKIIDIATTSGDTNIKTNSTDYTFNGNTLSGSIFVMEDFKNKSRKMSKNYGEVQGNGDLKIIIRSVSGDQRLLRYE